jgi:hypothetical protein
MPKAKSFEAFLAQGAQRSRPDERGIVNDKQERRPLASGAEINYERAQDLEGVSLLECLLKP